jgi:hypothetical protein
VYLNGTVLRTLTFVFNDFDGEIFVSHSEDLEVTEDGFLRLCVTVDLDAEEVSLILPMEFTLSGRHQ